MDWLADQYTYESLSYDHEYCQPIRLLRILPHDPDSLISRELWKTYFTTSEGRRKLEAQVNYGQQQTTERLENVEYDALSYVWGNSRVRYAIYVNGKRLLITRNLRSFLL